MAEELLDFEAIEKNRYENMSFAKRIVLCSFTEILFQRKLLPKEAFKAVRLKGIKLFVFDADHDDAYENLMKLSNICDEIENESVKTLRFLINFSEENKEHVGEVFEIHIAYGENITVNLKLGESMEQFRYDSRTYKKDFNVFIMRLRQFCRMLRDLPEGSYGRYHVVYNSGKKMRENACEYFTKVVRAPFVWEGPKQDICGIVGKFNGKQIGLKMSVGTLFGTGATDSMALAEHLKEENWDEGGWDEQRENTQKRFDQSDIPKTPRYIPYKQDELEEKQQDVVETYRNDIIDAFEWNDDLEGNQNENAVMNGEKKLRKRRRDDDVKKREENMIEKEKKQREKEEEIRKVEKEKEEVIRKKKKEKEEEIRKEKKRRAIEDKKKKELKEKNVNNVVTSDDGMEDGDCSSNDSAQMGTDINTSTVMEMNEEANEKEGRMDMRRKRRQRMMEKKKDANTTLEEVVYESCVSLGDITKAVEKTPGDSKSTTTTSSESLSRTPGIVTKKKVLSQISLTIDPQSM